MSDPGIVPDGNPVPGTPIEEALVILFALEILRGAIGEVVQRRPLHWVHAGINAHIGGDIGELADLAIGNLRAADAVGIVTKRRVRNGATRPDLGIAPQRRFMHPRGRVDRGFQAQRLHAAILGAKAVTSTMRSATCARTSSSWKIPSRATPAVFFSAIIATTTARLVASSDAVGSSSSSTG